MKIIEVNKLGSDVGKAAVGIFDAVRSIAGTLSDDELVSNGVASGYGPVHSTENETAIPQADNAAGVVRSQ